MLFLNLLFLPTGMYVSFKAGEKIANIEDKINVATGFFMALCGLIMSFIGTKTACIMIGW